MKKPLIFILGMFFFNSEILSQTPLPYITGFDNAAEQSGWQEFRKGFISNSNWSYVTFNTYSVPNALAHFYPVVAADTVDDWFVSPQFDFSLGGRIDSVFHNFSGFGIPVPEDELSIYLLTGSPDPGLAIMRILLHDYKINYTNDNAWHTDSNIIIPPVQGPSFIAFRYKTMINWIDVIFDNLRISGNAPANINSLSDAGNEIQLYPNPVLTDLTVIPGNFAVNELRIFDITGKPVKTIFTKDANHTCIADISDLQDGIYILYIKSPDNSYNKLFVKQ